MNEALYGHPPTNKRHLQIVIADFEIKIVVCGRVFEGPYLTISHRPTPGERDDKAV